MNESSTIVTTLTSYFVDRRLHRLSSSTGLALPMEFSIDDIAQYESMVAYMQTHPELYTDIEKSEAYGRLGIVYFYTGQYAPAIHAFEESVGCRFMLKPDKTIGQIYILLGISYYRIRNFHLADKYFDQAANISKVDAVLASMGLCNSAITKYQLKDTKRSFQKANEAVKLMASIDSNQNTEAVSLFRSRVIRNLFLIVFEYCSSADLSVSEES